MAFVFTVTVNPTASANGRRETRSAGESWRSAGKRRRLRNSAGYERERRRKRRKGRRRRAKKGVTATVAAAAQMKAWTITH